MFVSTDILQFNSEPKLLSAGGFSESLCETSPASIHRKDSYRRAQEQKLFLDSNQSIKQARFATSRKVKTIPDQDRMNQQRQQQMMITQLNAEKLINMTNNDELASTTKTTTITTVTKHPETISTNINLIKEKVSCYTEYKAKVTFYE